MIDMIDSIIISDIIEQLMNANYLRILLFKLGMIFLIFGGINYFIISTFDFNLIEEIFGKGYLLNVIYFIIGISAILIMFDRNTYLPFLGPMVAPCSVLKDITPFDAKVSVKVIVEPKAKVMYWASEPSTEKLEKIKNWKDAYLAYENAGVVTADDNGVAILKVRPPQPYRVIFKGKLEPHIHYRVCGNHGWMGSIHTVLITDNKVEGFLSKVTKDIYDKKNKLDISDYSASIF